MFDIDLKLKMMLGEKIYKENSFPNKFEADKKAEKLQAKYGYRPVVFKLSKDGKFKKYVVVEPKGLKEV